MTTIKAKVKFDEASHLGAFRLHMWHRYQVWLMLRTFLSVALILAGIILLMSQGPNPMPVLMLMVGTFALLRPLIWKIMHGRNLRNSPATARAYSTHSPPRACRSTAKTAKERSSGADYSNQFPPNEDYCSTTEKNPTPGCPANHSTVPRTY